MPKRAKSPVIEDDNQYLVVYHPYPAHPDLDNEDQRRALAYWISAAMRGPEDLIAIHFRRVVSSL